jgi:hypothetical protein
MLLEGRIRDGEAVQVSAGEGGLAIAPERAAAA